jgi:DUF4097 and DUF4098 domain-containing protein YvlB
MLFRAAVLLALPITFAGAQSSSDNIPVFKGQIAEGSWLRIRTMKGNVQVREATGRDVIVTARRRYGYGRSGEIKFDVHHDGSNVTVCALWEQTRRCDEDGYDSGRGWNRDRSDDGSADFTVELPRGIKLVASTGNGDVDIRNAGSEVRGSSGNGEVTIDGAGGSVEAASGNGDVRVDRAGGPVRANTGNGNIRVVTASGPVNANTGNGRIEVDMAALSDDDDMTFNTGNGSIRVSAPSNLSAEIDSNVSYNKFETDFPLTVPGRWNTRRIQGTIGNGGRRIRFNTGNGSVTLRKHD